MLGIAYLDDERCTVLTRRKRKSRKIDDALVVTDEG